MSSPTNFTHSLRPKPTATANRQPEPASGFGLSCFVVTRFRRPGPGDARVSCGDQQGRDTRDAGHSDDPVTTGCVVPATTREGAAKPAAHAAPRVRPGQGRYAAIAIVCPILVGRWAFSTALSLVNS